MAIYRGREVQIVNYVQPGLTIPDTIQVVDKDGQSYSPKVSEVQFTEAEKAILRNTIQTNSTKSKSSVIRISSSLEMMLILRPLRNVRLMQLRKPLNPFQ